MKVKGNILNKKEKRILKWRIKEKTGECFKVQFLNLSFLLNVLVLIFSCVSDDKVSKLITIGLFLIDIVSFAVCIHIERTYIKKDFLNYRCRNKNTNAIYKSSIFDLDHKMSFLQKQGFILAILCFLFLVGIAVFLNVRNTDYLDGSTAKSIIGYWYIQIFYKLLQGGNSKLAFKYIIFDLKNSFKCFFKYKKVEYIKNILELFLLLVMAIICLKNAEIVFIQYIFRFTK